MAYRKLNNVGSLPFHPRQLKGSIKISNVTFKVVESFYSLQGEGRRVGVPSFFIRVFGCNLNCSGFGMPKGMHSTEVDEIVDSIDLSKIISIKQLPLAKTGCDSYVAIDKRFRHLCKDMDGEMLMNAALDACSGSLKGVDLVLTGGEPLLQSMQSKWVTWFNENIEHLRESGHITFETNGTQLLKPELVEFIKAHPEIQFTISVSPKLSRSGVEFPKAIKPEVIAQLQTLPLDFYLKYVVADKSDIEEALAVTSKDFKLSGTERVFFMPCGGTFKEYEKTARSIADLCMANHLHMSDRLHLRLFKNAWAT